MSAISPNPVSSVSEGTTEKPPLSKRESVTLIGYVLLLVLMYQFSVLGVAGVAVQFILKNTLKLSAPQQATFGFLADTPYFIAFVFGFLRDRWRPFGQGDRGYFLLLPPLLAGANLLLAFRPFTYGLMLGAYVLIAIFSVWLGAAVRGLMAIIAQHHGMTGRFAVLLLIIPRLIAMISSAVGGRLAIPAYQHQAYLISALLCLPLMLLPLWKPHVVFAHENETLVPAVPEGVTVALRRLIRHRTIYLPAMITFLWAFAPGWGTALFFYLTNTVKLSETAYGNGQAVQGAGMLLTVLAYTGLCYRVRLRPLLWWGTFFGVLGCPLFLFIHTPTQANPVFLLAGASLGIALCAYGDLLVRCCPKDLEGAALMVTTAAGYIAADSSDIFGSWLYEKGGFLLALAVSTLFTGLIFFILPFIPKRLTSPREGEPLAENHVLYPVTVVAQTDTISPTP